MQQLTNAVTFVHWIFIIIEIFIEVNRSCHITSYYHYQNNNDNNHLTFVKHFLDIYDVRTTIRILKIINNDDCIVIFMALYTKLYTWTRRQLFVKLKFPMLINLMRK